MIRIVKLGNQVLVNVEPEYTDEDGNVVKVLPSTKTDLLKIVQDTILYLQKSRLQSVLEQYDYNSLGDILFYANQNDTEAQGLLNWYLAYDNEIWNYINGLSAKTKTDILNDLQDLIAVEESIYQSSIQASPLP